MKRLSALGREGTGLRTMTLGGAIDINRSWLRRPEVPEGLMRLTAPSASSVKGKDPHDQAHAPVEAQAGPHAGAVSRPLRECSCPARSEICRAPARGFSASLSRCHDESGGRTTARL